MWYGMVRFGLLGFGGKTSGRSDGRLRIRCAVCMNAFHLTRQAGDKADFRGFEFDVAIWNTISIVSCRATVVLCGDVNT